MQILIEKEHNTSDRQDGARTKQQRFCRAWSCRLAVWCLNCELWVGCTAGSGLQGSKTILHHHFIHKQCVGCAACIISYSISRPHASNAAMPCGLWQWHCHAFAKVIIALALAATTLSPSILAATAAFQLSSPQRYATAVTVWAGRACCGMSIAFNPRALRSLFSESNRNFSARMCDLCQPHTMLTKFNSWNATATRFLSIILVLSSEVVVIVDLICSLVFLAN